jgi:hypothetical protein
LYKLHLYKLHLCGLHLYGLHPRAAGVIVVDRRRP